MFNVREEFGDIDIYLFDQILRGRIAPGMRVFDAGCGAGRNLVYLLRSGFDVSAIDADADAVARVRELAGRLAPRLPSHPGSLPRWADHFRAESIEQTTFPDGFADVVVSSAVLHFARDDEQFMAMVRGTWRVLKRGGLLVARLASSIGMEDQVRRIAGRRHVLPDGSERYLVDARLLTDLTRDLGGALADPLKTTVVQDQRCMTTWVVRKH